ncbi:transcriptional regulator family: Fungal Specific TF [Penicillium maclennaniae]|uniref:transcriptional regulator family: Fungal Specific TF n=1 Tax=Penicillium maclennaniae TaxID=1343394 RepID=UPI0025414A17|nr:transcriptional regulator family: Fungal Specific TF [Penicillium maclennaniae]KAJ5666490.1 transcriptional regulator family: Fungal Specific TF [Penicillium maclennaniae]
MSREDDRRISSLSMHPMHPIEEPRKRTARACDSCYRRKIKCDAALPSCNWCSHHNLPCTFDRVVQRKRKTGDDDDGNRPKASKLSERISRIEQLLAENLMRDPGSVPSDLSRIGDASTTASNSPKGQAWIQARTGQTIASNKLSPTRAPWEKERGQATNNILIDLRSHDPFELPDPRILRLHVDAFKNSVLMRRIFPVIDPELFEETVTSAYQQSPNNFQFGQASTRACIIAFVAFTTRLPPVQTQVKASTTIPIDHDAMATRAQFLLSQMLQEPASLEGAQAVTMLTLYELSSGNMRATNYFAAIAARLLFMLGANLMDVRMSSSERGKKKHQLLRNLFWICYTLDKDVSLRTGQPPTIADENCDLTLPPGYVDQAHHDVENEDVYFDQPVFPFDLRLSIIKSRAHSALYSVSAMKKCDADLLKSIRELDDELEAWRLSLSPHWRPTMSFSPEASDPNISMHSVMLRLNYYLCMSIIHQASSRCKAWQEGSGMMDGVSSSLALSVEASRSTLCYLEAAEHVLVDGVFWTLIFYPMSALLSIFCSILQNPLDPRSRDDLGRLKMATRMMERVFLRKLPDNEAVHLKLVAEFVVELKRLAEAAIDKAWLEQSRCSLLSP